jgi:uncharacterized protein (TIGR02391 family)
MAAETRLEEANLEALCAILGATDDGLSGTEIGRYLAECNITDPSPGITKRRRLYDALSRQQRVDGCANSVLRFVKHVMSPVRYMDARERFADRRSRLNGVFAFNGLRLEEDGRLVRRTGAARTISQAEEAAGALRKALAERRVHADVLRFCRAELLEDNYFHAVFEATKSVAEKLRQMAGLTSDGGVLVDEALGMGKALPRIAFNTLRTDSERSEHTGLMNLIKGVFGAFRNTTAHAPKIHWDVSEQDALDILTTLSLVHRRLDSAVRTPQP